MLSGAKSAVDHTAATGASSGPPVVFIHGFCAAAEQDWPADRWAKPLAKAGRDSLVVHLPGHPGGPEITSADEVSTSRVLAWIAETVKSIAGGAVDLVGYSLGARLAWDLAGTGRLPVRRLVLGGLSPGEPFAQLDPATLKGVAHGEREPADPLTGGMAGMVSQSPGDTDALICLIEGLAREPFDPSATPPAVPTLLVGGQDDGMVEGIDDLAGIPADARVTRVPGDHAEALAGEPFRATVAAFLQIDA